LRFDDLRLHGLAVFSMVIPDANYLQREIKEIFSQLINVTSVNVSRCNRRRQAGRQDSGDPCLVRAGASRNEPSSRAPETTMPGTREMACAVNLQNDQTGFKVSLDASKRLTGHQAPNQGKHDLKFSPGLFHFKIMPRSGAS
jgi:hypothetical protein